MAEIEIPRPDGLSQLPIATISGIYFLWYGAQIIYVGQSRHITQRVYQHIQDGTKRFDGMSFIAVKASRLNQVERYYIEKLLPKHNQCGIATAMRKLRQHYLGISVAALESLGLEETFKVRIPRKKCSPPHGTLA